MAIDVRYIDIQPMFLKHFIEVGLLQHKMSHSYEIGMVLFSFC